MNEITYDSVVTEVKRVAAVDPGFTYQSSPVDGSCLYVHESGYELTPGCIFGHVMHNLGMTLTDLHRWDRDDNNKISQELVRIGVSLTDEERETLDRVQRRQDEGMSWEDATAIL